MTDWGADGGQLVLRGRQVPDHPLVSVCILVLADSALAIHCLESLAKGSGGLEVETVVVANGTPAEARKALEQRDDVVLVRSGHNLGFAGGNNLAARVARGRYLLLLNDDSELESDYISRLVTTIESDPSIGAVGGRILSEDGSLQEAGSVLWSDGWAAHVGLGRPAGDDAYSYVREVDYTSANGLLIRRTAWDAVGGLDERYFPAYYEDVDFCMALRSVGMRIVYEPRARLVHLESQSTSYRFRDFLLIRNRDQFVAKWQDELSQFGDRDGDRDDAAITRALHRSRGTRPHVLAVADTTAANDEALWDTVEALAAAGWTVTVAVPTTADSPVPTDGADHRADHLVDLGVDVQRGDALDILSATEGDYEALIIGSATVGNEAPIVRPDGSDLPVVLVTGPAEADRVRTAVDEVGQVARRQPERPPPGRTAEDRYPVAMAEGGQGNGEGTPLGSSSAAGPAEVSSITVPSEDQAARELRAALSEIEVKDRYIEDLEAKLDNLETRLDEATAYLESKTAYIESLPSVRLKAWAKGLWTTTKS